MQKLGTQTSTFIRPGIKIQLSASVVRPEPLNLSVPPVSSSANWAWHPLPYSFYLHCSWPSSTFKSQHCSVSTEHKEQGLWLRATGCLTFTVHFPQLFWVPQAASPAWPVPRRWQEARCGRQ